MKSVEFVNVRLDVASEIILGDDGLKGDDALEWFLNIPKTGYKCSYSYSENRNGWIATLTGGDNTINSGRALSQWGKDLASCVEKLYLIHEVIDKDHSWINAEKRLGVIIREAMKRFTGD